MIAYPLPVSGSPRSAGPGMWCTATRDNASIHLWRLADEADED
ncbi:hypothetical protein ABZ468_44020 [Streptomyces sp. NPDC005708]